MRKVWRIAKSIRFRDLNSIFMLIEFDDIWDKDRVLRDGSWSFDKHLVLMTEVEGCQQVHQIQITEALFWIRLHDLPLIARNEYVRNLIRKVVGEVVEMDLDEGEMKWGFMRVRIKLDIMIPLL
ncbi:hypothetical protein F2P56_013970 [Juglans regia]|uniref:DUF4283 domain-containing protein n=1 Tax=Juglans regia TaxID=51240 RepID=A0A833XCA6_JUGRE|nr:hypothetical protein F2P56_013970 [Juglans regia]